MKSMVHCRHGIHDWLFSKHGLINVYTKRKCSICKRREVYFNDSKEWEVVTLGTAEIP